MIKKFEKHWFRKQALVFDSINGIPQKNYILENSKTVPPKNIIFISRIPNN